MHGALMAPAMIKVDSQGRVWLRGSERSRWAGKPINGEGQTAVSVLIPWTRADEVERASLLMRQRAGAPCTIVCVQDDDGCGPVQLLNAAFRSLLAPWVVYAAQDAFAGRRWLAQALESVAGPDGPKLFAFNDGKWFGHLAAFGLVRRSWAQGLYGGNLFHSDYHQHFGDVELTLVAQQQRVFAYHPHAVLVEVDYEKDTRSVALQDRERFLLRQAGGFDGRVLDPTLLTRFR